MPQAYVFTAFGGPEVERFADLPVPDPGPGQLRIAVRAAGVNPADWKLRSGLMPAVAERGFPIVLGNEASGVVEAYGEGVAGRVAAAAPDSVDAVPEEVGRLAALGVLRPTVTAVFGLDGAARALRSAEDGHATGKTVIEVTA